MPKQKKYAVCRERSGFPHAGRPFTCRACGKQACWNCALHFWREKQLPIPGSVVKGLDAWKKACDTAVSEGKLLGCCSDKCRKSLPQRYGADFRLPNA